MASNINAASASPSVNDVDEGWHEAHDIMNLSILPFIIFTNLYYLFLDQSFMYFTLQFCIFAAYLLIDTIWVIWIPQSVASPKTILIHHIITMFGWFLPIIFGMHLAEWCAVGLLVEINTWLLIARRNFRHISILTPLFFVSWVLFRLIYYPFKGYQFIKLVAVKYAENGYVDMGSVSYIILWGGLTFLNFKWSYDLVRKNFSKGKPSDNHDKGL